MTMPSGHPGRATGPGCETELSRAGPRAGLGMGLLPDWSVAPQVLQGLGRTLGPGKLQGLGTLQALLTFQVPLKQGEDTPLVCAWKGTGHLRAVWDCLSPSNGIFPVVFSSLCNTKGIPRNLWKVYCPWLDRPTIAISHRNSQHLIQPNPSHKEIPQQGRAINCSTLR